VNILGLSFNLSGSARAQPGVGVATALAGEYDFPLDDHFKWRDVASYFTVQYGGRNFSDMFGQVSMGPHIIIYGNVNASALMVCSSAYT
jgi:hypothetical protein